MLSVVRILLLAAAASTAVSVTADEPKEHEVYDLGEEFAGKAKGWKTDRDGFMNGHPRCWYFKEGSNRLSFRRDCVRFFGMEVCDNSLVFGKDGLERIELSVFNKGLSEEFVKGSRTTEIVNLVSAKVHSDRVDVTTVPAGEGKTMVTFRWRDLNPRLEASVGETVVDGVSRAEYMNFTLSPGAKAERVTVSPEKNVRKKGLGDVYLVGIPPANQGQTGFCAPATVSRILGYYGHDVGMHELAMMLETEHGKGTMIGGVFPALTEIAQTYGLVRTDCWNPVIHCNPDTDRETLREERVADKAGMVKFRAAVIGAVDRGFPLFWTIDRLFPWDAEGQESDGGHARLIVGYNRLKDEVFYSDSWGEEKEFKRAPLEEAWAATVFLTCLSPK